MVEELPPIIPEEIRREFSNQIPELLKGQEFGGASSMIQLRTDLLTITATNENLTPITRAQYLHDGEAFVLVPEATQTLDNPLAGEKVWDPSMFDPKPQS